MSEDLGRLSMSSARERLREAFIAAIIADFATASPEVKAMALRARQAGSLTGAGGLSVFERQQAKDEQEEGQLDG